MENWVRVLDTETVAEGSVVKADVKGRSLILTKAGGSVYALFNECPHLGCAMHRGTLSGYHLSCPCHSWVFDIRNGEFTAAPEIKIPTFPVKVEGGEILVNLGGK